MKDNFSSILNIHRCLKIHLSGLISDGIEKLIRINFKSKLASSDIVSKNLVEEIQYQSQGIAFVANLLCKALLDDPSVSIMRNILDRHRSNITKSFSPKDAYSAVIAQFDKLSQQMKIILKVAAVAG